MAERSSATARVTSGKLKWQHPCRCCIVRFTAHAATFESIGTRVKGELKVSALTDLASPHGEVPLPFGVGLKLLGDEVRFVLTTFLLHASVKIVTITVLR